MLNNLFRLGSFINMIFIYHISQKAPVSHVKIIRFFSSSNWNCVLFKPMQSALYSGIAKSFPTFFSKLKKSYVTMGQEGQRLL